MTTACGGLRRVGQNRGTQPVTAGANAQAAPASTPGNGLLKDYRVLVSPDGGRVDWGTNNLVLYSRIENLEGGGDLSSEIYVNNPDGSNEVCLTCDNQQIPHLSNDQPAWLPNGNYFLFQSADPTLPTNGVSPAVAKRLVQGGFGYNNNLWLMSADGSTAYQLTHLSAAEATLHPHFSPDGTKVFWSASEPRRTGGQGWELRLADFHLDGGPALQNVQTLTPLGTSGTQVYESHDVSADNSTLLYSYSPGQPLDLDIYVTNLTTNTTTNLTNSPGVWDEHAHFSPDGKHIAWVSSRGLPFTPTQNWEQSLRTEVWVMDADGSNQRQVTFFNTPGQPGATGDRVIMADLAWSPDGNSLIATRSNIGQSGVNREVVILDLAL
jgi:Tol biopolymer transport system component